MVLLIIILILLNKNRILNFFLNKFNKNITIKKLWFFWIVKVFFLVNIIYYLDVIYNELKNNIEDLIKMYEELNYEAVGLRYKSMLQEKKFEYIKNLVMKMDIEYQKKIRDEMKDQKIYWYSTLSYKRPYRNVLLILKLLYRDFQYLKKNI